MVLAGTTAILVFSRIDSARRDQEESEVVFDRLSVRSYDALLECLTDQRLDGLMLYKNRRRGPDEGIIGNAARHSFLLLQETGSGVIVQLRRRSDSPMRAGEFHHLEQCSGPAA